MKTKLNGNSQEKEGGAGTKRRVRVVSGKRAYIPQNIIKIHYLLSVSSQTDELSGSYEITFNAQDLTSGVYFYQIKTNNFVSTKKLLLLK